MLLICRTANGLDWNRRNGFGFSSGWLWMDLNDTANRLVWVEFEQKTRWFGLGQEISGWYGFIAWFRQGGLQWVGEVRPEM